MQGFDQLDDDDDPFVVDKASVPRDCGIIYPDSGFRTAWDITMFLMILY